ncbi:hypothetical protein PIB30_054935 [Stylosanthes scabra]|uniref:F-box domain-containing protein n=1 Tax=Stylosanthes scabra TaxID=79078 RepID=A0ABU6XGQ9_9FABA|nr:hypothetical protein [Stylosanthes scabra]
MASTTIKRVSLGHRHECQNWPKLVGCSWSILPEELVAEILVRLPVSCLVKLKSVCRSWRALISSSQFAKSHLQRSIPIPHFAYTFPVAPKQKDRRIGIFSAESPFHNPITKVISFSVGTGLMLFDIIGSANGLLCLLHLNYVACRAKLWNPCTRMESEWLNIDGDLSKNGFGYDHVHDKYKLFGEVSPKSGSRFSSRICTLGEDSNSWRTIKDNPIKTVDYKANYKATFVPGNGALNWVSNGGAVIISLDLAKESYGEFSVPCHENQRGSGYGPKLSVLKNCLALCYDHKKTHWAVWLMKEYGKEESWTLVAMIIHSCEIDRSFIPMYLLLKEEGDGEQDLLLARCPPNKIVSCNLNDASLNFPVFDTTSDGLLDYPLSQDTSLRCFQIFHQTLVSPSHFGLPSSLSSISLIDE